MAGYQLYLVQQGREPDDWRPMVAVAIGEGDAEPVEVWGAHGSRARRSGTLTG